jgi:hypothetical protein
VNVWLSTETGVKALRIFGRLAAGGELHDVAAELTPAMTG